MKDSRGVLGDSVLGDGLTYQAWCADCVVACRGTEECCTGGLGGRLARNVGVGVGVGVGGAGERVWWV